jgi:hypothetical protein
MVFYEILIAGQNLSLSQPGTVFWGKVEEVVSAYFPGWLFSATVLPQMLSFLNLQVLDTKLITVDN